MNLLAKNEWLEDSAHVPHHMSLIFLWSPVSSERVPTKKSEWSLLKTLPHTSEALSACFLLTLVSRTDLTPLVCASVRPVLNPLPISRGHEEIKVLVLNLGISGQSRTLSLRIALVIGCICY
jgi:hypothetical protein